MTLEDLKIEYDKLQLKFGAKEIDSIYNGGCTDNQNICFVFMNPTRKNIASSKLWKGLKSPWIGIKNIWYLFYELKLLDKNIYDKIKTINNKQYKCYSVFYPIGNDRFSYIKSIDDINYIIDNINNKILV